jgi:hypothetical protein
MRNLDEVLAFFMRKLLYEGFSLADLEEPLNKKED